MPVSSANMTEEHDGASGPLEDEAFKQALTRVAPHLRAFGRSLCGCSEQADELAQETMLRAWAARDRYKAGTNFKAWTFTILRNRFYSEMRRNRFRGEYDEGVADRVLNAKGSQEPSVDLLDTLRALQTLPETHREALILVAVGGLSYEEIAGICDVALGTVKSRICRARAMLAHALESGSLPDFRHNFTLTGAAVDAFFEELDRVANTGSDLSEAA